MDCTGDTGLLSQRPAVAGIRRYAALAVVLFGFACGALVTEFSRRQSGVKGQVQSIAYASTPHTNSTHDGLMAMMTDEEYRQYVVKLCADAFPDQSKDVQDLDRAYRQEWERVAPHGYFYISIPFRAVLDEWGDPVKALEQRTISPSIVKAIGIWESLDWSRKHFVFFTQVSFSSINLFTWSTHAPGYIWNKDNLIIFDSRLWNLALALKGFTSPTNLFPVPLFHSAVPGFEDIDRCARRTTTRETRLFFAGTIDSKRRTRDVLVHGLKKRFRGIADVVINTKKVDRKTFVKAICHTTFVLCVSGTFPPTFMIYEAMHAGALPIFVVDSLPYLPNKKALTTRKSFSNLKSMDRFMPFGDNGVHFSKFGIMLRSNDPDLIDRIEAVISMKHSELLERQKYLKKVVKRFTTSGAFQYAIHTMDRIVTTSSYPLQVPFVGNRSIFENALSAQMGRFSGKHTAFSQRSPRSSAQGRDVQQRA